MSRSEELGIEKEVHLSRGLLRYRERGQGRPVVFIHGLVVNGDLWRKVAPPIADAGFRCIVPDLPLGSHSPALDGASPLTVPGVAALIVEFLEALDLEDAVLVANDTGGALSQMVVTEHPERIGGLVLTSCDCFDNFLPPMFGPMQWLAQFPSLLGALLQPLRWAPLRRIPLAYGWLSKRPTDLEISDGWVMPFLDDSEVRRDCIQFLADIRTDYTVEAAKKLSQFSKPVLLAWSAEDRFFPVDHAHRLAELFPEARVELIDDCYTFSCEDNPEDLVRSMRGFLESIAEEAPSERAVGSV